MAGQVHITPTISTTVNPFEVPPHDYTPWAKARMLLVGSTIFPLRVMVLLAALPIGALCGALAGCGLDARRQQKPSLIRRALMQPVRLCVRAVLWSLGFWWIRVVRRPGSCAGRARVLVVAPHFSLLDPFIMLYLEMPCSVSKISVSKIPLVGKVAVALQTIFVDRQDPQSKSKCMAAIRQRATDPAWPPLCVYPEGTCTNAHALISFKPGAFVPGAPVPGRRELPDPTRCGPPNPERCRELQGTGGPCKQYPGP